MVEGYNKESKPFVHQGRTFNLYTKTEKSQGIDRAVDLISSIILTVLTLGLGNLDPRLRNKWEKGLFGKTIVKIAVWDFQNDEPNLKKNLQTFLETAKAAHFHYRKGGENSLDFLLSQEGQLLVSKPTKQRVKNVESRLYGQIFIIHKADPHQPLSIKFASRGYISELAEKPSSQFLNHRMKVYLSNPDDYWSHPITLTSIKQINAVEALLLSLK